MKEDETDNLRQVVFFIFLILITGSVVVVSGDSLVTDRQVLLDLKSFLEERNHVNRGQYSRWNQQSSNPCRWSGILCTSDGSRVNGINLAASSISGDLYANFSSLTALTNLDLSQNTFSGAVPTDLSNCQNLIHLNLSHNILEGELNLTGLTKLETLDLSTNRIFGGIQFSLPRICSLIVANVSANNFSGGIDNFFDGCLNLQYLDLSYNFFSGAIWKGLSRLKEFSVAENYLSGEVSGSFFAENNCSLRVLDLSGNSFTGRVPRELSNCRNLAILNLWGNSFTGQIPSEIGLISSLEGLFLGNNTFSPTIPESLLNLDNLAFLDLSRNNFGGEIQQIFGGFTRLKILLLHGNSYTGGINSSGILKLPNLVGLDLSNNSFTGPLPVAFSEMHSLKFLILAYNLFNSTIPQEYGNFQALQALDLSFNTLTGQIPSSLGKLRSLLWLMLANNMLTGEIPTELGNCTSLLWLNLANNRLSGSIPRELMGVGRDPSRTFESNQRDEGVIASSGECWTMKRWIPADYPPFSFVHRILNRKTCRSIWDKLLKGVGLFSVCAAGSTVRTLQISGYLQLVGNQLSGELPGEIGKMQNFSMIHLGFNNLSGTLPPQIGQLPLLATFEEDSYLGDPLLKLPGFINNTMDSPPNQYSITGKKEHKKWVAVLVLLTMTMAFLICGLVSLVVCMLVKNPAESPGYLLEDTKHLRHDFASNSGSSSPWSSDTVKNHREGEALEQCTEEYCLVEERWQSRSYREKGSKVKRSFDLKWKSLTGNGFGWPHPNLVTLYGWCLDGTEKILVYEYMEGGSLEDLISDRTSFGVLSMELATGRRAVDGGEECLLEWARRVMGSGRPGLSRATIPVVLLGSGLAEGADEMSELLRIGIGCTAEAPQRRPNMKEVLAMLIKLSSCRPSRGEIPFLRHADFQD
ncbi:RECEPTOR KINASE-LIKE PROTEIN XA21 [Salix viminalis]|uniref:RECEPTOR KINASE-LIKE PROTEIN XA21 n=1 Tax=Salix viminalis TaxID=40686 RepID=A0A9Q0NVU2_SALVM|nr:RECEPTOR KINASE-LIKE PROTEIN XA21 [Salix viminalis]